MSLVDWILWAVRHKLVVRPTNLNAWSETFILTYIHRLRSIEILRSLKTSICCLEQSCSNFLIPKIQLFFLKRISISSSSRWMFDSLSNTIVGINRIIHIRMLTQDEMRSSQSLFQCFVLLFGKDCVYRVFNIWSSCILTSWLLITNMDVSFLKLCFPIRLRSCRPTVSHFLSIFRLSCTHHWCRLQAKLEMVFP